MDQIEQALTAVDGKHVAPLRAVVDAFEPIHAERLTLLCEGRGSRQAVAASWIIKSLAETGRTAEFDWSRLYNVLNTQTDWECALHLLQSVQHAPDPPSVDQVRPWIDHTRVLVRVWALDAFVRCALRCEALKDEANSRVANALADGPASLRARARALEKLL